MLLGQRISILSSAPDAKVAYSVEVPFDYPRDSDSASFQEFMADVHRKLDRAINVHGDKYSVDRSA